MARVKQIPPGPPLEKGGDSILPFFKGELGGISTTHLTLNDFDPHLKAYARDLRAHQTDAEQHLWQHLRRDQLGVRFLRQRTLGRYIVDFYAQAAKLVIELDGGQHFEPENQARDAERDAWLQAQGLKVLRFDDRQVLTETEAVLEVIVRVVGQSTVVQIPPGPPLRKGGANPPHSTEGSPLEAKGGANPSPSTEGFPRLEKGGEESPPFSKGG